MGPQHSTLETDETIRGKSDITGGTETVYGKKQSPEVELELVHIKLREVAEDT